MPTYINDWLQFDGTQPKRKRAELVCVLCHSKKVKCDLQSQRRQGLRSCTNCNSVNKDCELRHSKRAKNAKTAHRANTSKTQQLSRDPEANLPIDTNGAEGDGGPDAEPLCMMPGALPERITTLADPDVQRPELSPWNLQNQDFSIGSQGQNQGPNQGPSPSQYSHRSGGSRTEIISESQNGDIDTGFLQIYNRENDFDAQKQSLEATAKQMWTPLDAQEPELMESFLETYWEYCYAWCPVLDRDRVSDEISHSPLLANAIALAASHIQPPLVPHRGPAECYKAARTLFYNDEELDGLTALKSLTLFYYWAPRSPTIVHRHSSWYWTSQIIRHAQQMNLHREPNQRSVQREDVDLSLRRRIWWTAFARERLTALCQSKPAIIDPDDCNIQKPSLSDFPSDFQSQRKGSIFIHWVDLCSIVGKVAKTLYRLGYSMSASSGTPQHHLHELVAWVEAVPEDLKLQIGTSRTHKYDRDIHQLYLPYLTTVIILNLKRSDHPLPQALPPAILAASCIARILRDILSRGKTRFLMAITCWYCGIAFLPLLQATRIPHLSKESNECIDILERTVEQLQEMWASANVIRQGFERLRNTANDLLSPQGVDQSAGNATQIPLNDSTNILSDSAATDRFDWTTLFPFVTQQTNNIAKSLLTDVEQGIIPQVLPAHDSLFQETMMTQFDDLFVQYPDYGLDWTMGTPLAGQEMS